jgi:hypothetical protein
MSSKSKIRLDNSCHRIRSKLGGIGTPPVRKSYEGQPKIGIRKKNISSSCVTDAYLKTENQYKRHSDEKVKIDRSRSNSKGKQVKTFNTKSNVDLVELCNKSLNNLNNKIRPDLSPIRSKKKSVTNNEQINKVLFNDKMNNFNIEGTTQIYVNQIMMDKGISLEPTPTSLKDRKFSIMDVPADVILSNS